MELVLSLTWMFVLALFGAVCGLQVDFNKDSTAYYVSHLGTTLFKAERGIAVFVEGAWHSYTHGSLRLIETKPVSGNDHHGLGEFHGTQHSWLAGGSPGTQFMTTAKTYTSGIDVAFEYTFPNGANGTCLVNHEKSASHDEVITNFPAFSMVLLPNALSWSGSFVQPVMGFSKGPNGGPTVFFNGSDPNLSTVVVGSAMNNFKASSAGPGTTWDGMGSAWVPGTTGTIRSLEAGFTHRFLLHLGTQRGITSAISEWGKILQSVYNTYKLPDLTLTKIGYQTDNGAAYAFCRGNCSRTLLDKVHELQEVGIPMGYLSFQGSGASASAQNNERTKNHLGLDGVASSDRQEGAPWCINTWGPDLQNGTSSYPVPVKDFQEALGVPLQLYAPYFCPSSFYFRRNNSSSPWRSVVSDTSLPGCNSFGFQNVKPQQARSFYDWFFEKGREVGMVSFESDFMNQNYNCVPKFIHSSSAAEVFLKGMADAALNANLTIQWCYATPTDVLASLDMPSVTNFRVSFDYCYGESWKIGTSSLLVWALGVAPSKDTLWTTDNNHLVVPGCDSTPDHENPAAELHLVLALMSMGPVGISDALGFSNSTLIKRAIAMDGTLLKPSKPLTTVDSMIARGDQAPNGQVYGTYSAVGDLVAYQFVSFQLAHEYTVPVGDFVPSLDNSAGVFVYRRFGPSCQDGAAIDSCVSILKGGDLVSSFVLPKSDFGNKTGGSDYIPALTTVWPVCDSSGWTLLGDLSKFVPLSPQRFTNVSCADPGISFIVKGSPGEVVMVTVLPLVNSSNTTVLVVRVCLPESGIQTVKCPGIDCVGASDPGE